MFDGLNGGARKRMQKADYQRRRAKFVFHMTDWLEDLRELNRLYEHPERFKASVACGPLYGILLHVVPHLQAAVRALDGTEPPDPFVD